MQTLDSLNQKIDQALPPEKLLIPLDRQILTDDSTLVVMNNPADSSRKGDMDNPALPSTVDSDFLSTNSGTFPRNVPTLLESFQLPPQQTTEVHNILAWPTVQAVLECDEADLSHWNGHNQQNESWLIGISAEFPKIAVDRSVDILYIEAGVLDLEGSRSITLNKGYVESLCAAYFQSFHCIYPILDPYYFYAHLLPQVCSQSFSEAYDESALVLLVLSLGSVAQEGVTGSSFVDEGGRETGIRGGTVLRPPGHIFLTEAKRRLGIAFTSWNLNNVQCCILFALVYILWDPWQY